MLHDFHIGKVYLRARENEAHFRFMVCRGDECEGAEIRVLTLRTMGIGINDRSAAIGTRKSGEDHDDLLVRY